MDIEYPTAAEIHEIHERIVVNSDKTESGTRSPESVESAIEYISEGYFGELPETIHEKAAHLMWLIVADHPYVDGNKRTALWSAAYLYDLNGYRLEPDDTIRTILRDLATDAEDVDLPGVEDYLHQRTIHEND